MTDQEPLGSRADLVATIGHAARNARACYELGVERRYDVMLDPEESAA